MATSLATIDDLTSSLTGSTVRAEQTAPTRRQDLLVALLPEWLDNAAGRVISFAGLKPGWDSHGAEAVSIAVIRDALALLRRVQEFGMPAPHLVPTSRGGVQFEWDVAGAELEIELQPGGHMLAIFDNETGTAWDRELPPNDLEPLVKAFRVIARARHDG